MNPLGWTLLAVATAGAVLLYTFRHRPAVRELSGIDAIVAEVCGPAREVVVVDPVTTPAADWDVHVDQAVAIANSGKRYDIACRGCGGRRVTGDRQQVLAHLVAVHGPETPDMAADLALYNQEMNA